jgi:hypothetical protein
MTQDIRHWKQLHELCKQVVRLYRKSRQLHHASVLS